MAGATDLAHSKNSFIWVEPAHYNEQAQPILNNLAISGILPQSIHQSTTRTIFDNVETAVTTHAAFAHFVSSAFPTTFFWSSKTTNQFIQVQLDHQKPATLLLTSPIV
ncbi:MAG: hypothetical protein HXX08_14205 [Chloroflexi bacterium]|uniref:Uncharacterized protein n=1 Tax=Candidatus Chlorohelix allophototropha TaxID=3003348 RepID=A0A8T7M4I8_9CHLR|nr:hypothetical protein [Chloroflexota bacterium]WJW69995.1 hypothetical protein OZ401_004796 [Chloroflexota bacterium L227-S17]